MKMKTKYSIESETEKGWIEDGGCPKDCFGENSTIYETREEAAEALEDAIYCAKELNYCEEFIDSLYICVFEEEEEEEEE